MKEEILTGHNGFRYKVIPGWGTLDTAVHPVKDCHEMVMDRNGFLYLLTNDTHNNILVYNKDGKLVNAWGTTYPGAHGLTLSEENGEAFLFITDCERHQVIKTNLQGDEIMILDQPVEIAGYETNEVYKPTETAVAPNGDIYVTDGYGLQYVIQYDHAGNYIRHWGGKGDEDDQFDCAHGVAIDNRNGGELSLLITSRNHNAWKQFTMDGKYISTIHIPGSFVCRPVVHKENIYGAVFRSQDNQRYGSGYITILDKTNKVVSTPGASEPVYINNSLQPQEKQGDFFIHPHDVCIDNDDNLYVPQWNSKHTYPVKLERIR